MDKDKDALSKSFESSDQEFKEDELLSISAELEADQRLNEI